MSSTSATRLLSKASAGPQRRDKKRLDAERLEKKGKPLTETVEKNQTNKWIVLPNQDRRLHGKPLNFLVFVSGQRSEWVQNRSSFFWEPLARGQLSERGGNTQIWCPKTFKFLLRALLQKPLNFFWEPLTRGQQKFLLRAKPLNFFRDS